MTAIARDQVIHGRRFNQHHMNFIDMQSSVDEAKTTLRHADALTEKIATMLLGRMRTMKSWSQTEVLKSLKKELRDFNSHTRKWGNE